VNPVDVISAVWNGFPGFILSAFLECLFLAMFIDALRKGHRIYWVAAIALCATLYARVTEGFMPSGPNTALKIGGLVVAGVILAIDLLTEEVEEEGGEAAPQI
jgi:hypothetical protein